MQKQLLTKMGMVGGLVLLLLIPLGLIESVISERVSFREQARKSIRLSWTGQQKIIGPILVVPYVEHFNKRVWDKKVKRYKSEERQRSGKLFLLPKRLHINGEAETEERKRGLYSIPVYTTKLDLVGEFSNERLVEAQKDFEARMAEKESKKKRRKRRKKKDEPKLEWKQPYLSVLVSDLRGMIKQPVVSWGEEKAIFEAGPKVKNAGSGMHALLKPIKVDKEQSLPFKLELTVRGMEQLNFSPLGKDTKVKLASNWPHPSFIGRYLPNTYTVSESGFKAEWVASSFSSLMPQALNSCLKGNCNQLLSNTFGVSLIKTADIYQQSERSVKYGILFLVLTFTLFFVYEVMKSMAVHPVQYLLVGLALSIFFLLLVSISEHFSFTTAYVIAAAACTSLLGFYISAVLKSAKGGVLFTGMLALLYGVLYFIIKSEDNALLMGSVLLFVVLAAVMLITRRIDWYGLSLGDSEQNKTIKGDNEK